VAWSKIRRLLRPQAALARLTWGLLPLAVSGQAAAEGAGAPKSWLMVPGGTHALAEVAGIDPGTDPGLLLPSLLRRAHPLPNPSSTTVKEVLDHLTAVGPVTSSESIPTPFPPDLLERLVFRRHVPEGDRLRVLLSDRKAALFCRGLLALDDETLAHLIREPEVLAQIHERLAPEFAAFAGTFRIHGGTLQLPGGPAAVPLWRATVGREPTPPGSFLLTLLSADAGRLAWLFDTLARADASHQAFVMNPPGESPGHSSRFARVRALFSRAPGWWKPQAFLRRRVDPSWVLLNVAVTPRGELGGSTSRAVWEAILNGRLAPEPGERGSADAAWLVERIGLAPPVTACERFERLLFAQRLQAALPNLDTVQWLTGTHAFAEAPALVLALEQLGPPDPQLWADAAEQVAQSSKGTNQERVATSLAQFQGALAIVARARWARALPQEESLALTRSLVAAIASGDGVAFWLDRELLPALGAEAGQAETAVARAVSGLSSRRGSDPPIVRWEGLFYRADPATALFRRFEEGRRRQGGPSLDDALLYAREVTSFCKGGGGTTGLRAAAERVAASRSSALSGPSDPRSAARVALEKGNTKPALETAEALLGQVLTSIAYAAHSGTPEAAALANRHDFGLTIPDALLRKRTAWSLAGEISGTDEAWRLRGALLGLDIGLGHWAPRRVLRELPAHPPAIDHEEAQALALQASLMSPFQLTDQDRDEVASALQRGRERVAELRQSGEDGVSLAEEARLEPERRRALGWLLASEPAKVEGFFSLSELMWLGGGKAGRGCGAWGAPAVLDGGPLCLWLPPPRPWSDLAGLGRGAIAQRLTDPALKTLEALKQLNLPASLAPAVLEIVLQDVVDRAQPADRHDGVAVGRFIAALPREYFEDLVASLVDGGPLVALPKNGTEQP